MQRIGLILLLLPLGAFGADIYRSIDENGEVVYSDRPRDASSELIVVMTFTPSPPASSATASGAAADDAPGQDAPLRAEIDPGPTAQEIAANRARNCQVARERAEVFNVGRRLYRTGADGERQYLSDAEIEEAKTKAEADVAAWCD